MAICRSSWQNTKGKIVYGFEHRAKNQPEVFQSGTFLLQKVETREGTKVDLKHLAVLWNCLYSRHSILSSWFFGGRCINRHCSPKRKRVLFVLILKRKIGDQNFPSGNQKFWFVFRCEGLFTLFFLLFGDHIFPYGGLKKKFQSPLGACLKKLISDPAGTTRIKIC